MYLLKIVRIIFYRYFYQHFTLLFILQVIMLNGKLIWMMETSGKLASHWAGSRTWSLLNRYSFTVLIVMVCCRSPWLEVRAGSRTSSRKSICCIGRIHSYHPSWWTWPLCQTASTSTSTPLYWAQVPRAPVFLPTDWWRTYWWIPHRNAWVTIRSLDGLYFCMDV